MEEYSEGNLSVDEFQEDADAGNVGEDVASRVVVNLKVKMTKVLDEDDRLGILT